MDGDAIVMRTEQLLQILKKLYAAFPKLQKVTTYAGPRSTLSKTPEELRAPAGGRTDPGLSGGGERQRRSAPGHPKGLHRRGDAPGGPEPGGGGHRPVGDRHPRPHRPGGRLGGARPVHRRHHQQNEAPPPLSHDFAPAAGTREDVLAGRFQVCTPDQILEECHLLLEHLDVDPLHFTSNHASNYLPLKGAAGGPGEVPLPDRPGAGRQDPPAQDPESGDLRCPESEDRPAGAFGSGGAVFIGSAAAASQPQVRPDKDGAPEQDQPPR